MVVVVFAYVLSSTLCQGICQNRELGLFRYMGKSYGIARNLCVEFCRLGVDYGTSLGGDGCVFLGFSLVVCFQDHEFFHRTSSPMFDLMLYLKGTSRVL